LLVRSLCYIVVCVESKIASMINLWVGGLLKFQQNESEFAVLGLPVYRKFCDEVKMPTITKKELIDRIAESTQAKRVIVKRIVQSFLDEVMTELSNDNRLEFRDFGVFETRTRVARVAQNPKTLERVKVPSKRTVKFKMGRMMKDKLTGNGSAVSGKD
jgi:integration host factor subunit beta